MKHAKLIIFFALMMLFLISCQLPEDEIRTKIDSTIPIGSSKKEVIQFLEANSFTFVINPKGMARPDNIKAEWMTATRKERILFREAYTTVYFFFDEQNETLLEYRIFTSYPASSFLIW